jgi:hypothetical protein
MLPYVTELGLEDGLRTLKGAGVKHLETDRFNPRGSVMKPTLKAYEAWNPRCNLEEIRELLWRGDEYYDELSGRISKTWLSITPDGTYERDPDYEKLQASKNA